MPQVPAPAVHKNTVVRSTTMEFLAHKSELLDELDLLQGAVEKKSTVPILSHFLLDAADFKLQIAATDLELAARSSCTAKVSGWEAGIRTPIRRSRVCSPTVRRPPRSDALLEVTVEMFSCQVIVGGSRIAM